MNRIAIILLIPIIFVALVGLLAILMALPVMLIINNIFDPEFISSVFGVEQISFWQGFFLTWLCAILFKSHNSNGSKS